MSLLEHGSQHPANQAVEFVLAWSVLARPGEKRFERHRALFRSDSSYFSVEGVDRRAQARRRLGQPECGSPRGARPCIVEQSRSAVGRVGEDLGDAFGPGGQDG